MKLGLTECWPNLKTKILKFKLKLLKSSVYISVKDTTVKLRLQWTTRKLQLWHHTKPSVYQDDMLNFYTRPFNKHTMIKNNDGTNQLLLAVGVRPHGSGLWCWHKITVTLPRDSMMKFTKQDVTVAKKSALFPALGTVLNENNVLLSLIQMQLQQSCRIERQQGCVWNYWWNT